MAILTNLESEEYNIEEDKLEVSNGLVTAKITISGKVIYVTNLHLNPMMENLRLKEIQNVEEILRPLLVGGAAQIWAGCFNSLCREDYEEEEWQGIERRRRENYWELPRTEVGSWDL